MKPRNFSVLCFDDNNIEFIKGNLKQNILMPEYIAKYEYTGLEELKEIVNNLINESRTKFLKIVYAGSELIDSVYFFDVNEQNITGEVYKNLKSDFDLDLKNYLIDYSIFESELNYAVYACCFPMEFKKNFEDFSKKTKLLTSYSDIYSSNFFYNSSEEVKLFLNIRSKNTILIIKQDDAILMTRGVNVGFDEIINQVAEEGGIFDKNDVLPYLRDIGVESYENEEKEKIADTIRNSIDRISLETQRTIDYYNRYIKKGEIKKIVITGKVSDIKGITKYYGQLFGLSTETLEPRNFVKDTDYEFENFDFIPEILGAYYEL